MKKISEANNIRDKEDLPRCYHKYLWLLGQFIQHSLLYLQGIRIPEPPELKSRFPDKNPAELIDIQREIYGCRFDWKTGSLIVCYEDEQFEISSEAKEIIAKTVSNNIVDLLGFDTRGFDFNRACNEAVDNIIEFIKNGQKKPL